MKRSATVSTDALSRGLLTGDLADAAEDADVSEMEKRILDAAAELVAAIGLQTTIDMVAKRAGVGRATVYRHFESKEAVLGAMALREIHEVFTEIAARTASETDARAKSVALFAATFQAAITNPIVRRIAIDDPRALIAFGEVREPIDPTRTMQGAMSRALDEAREEAGLPKALAWTATITELFISTMSGYVLRPETNDLDSPREIERLASIAARMHVDEGLTANS